MYYQILVYLPLSASDGCKSFSYQWTMYMYIVQDIILNLYRYYNITASADSFLEPNISVAWTRCCCTWPLTFPLERVLAIYFNNNNILSTYNIQSSSMIIRYTIYIYVRIHYTCTCIVQVYTLYTCSCTTQKTHTIIIHILIRVYEKYLSV